MVRFAVCTLVAVVLVGTATALVSRHIASEEAVRDASVRTVNMAQGIAAPLVDADVRRGDPAAVEVLDTVLRNRMRDGSVSHIVLYDMEGWILWADDPALVGTQDPLRPEVLSALDDEGAVVTHTEEHPRTTGDAEQDGSLVEVYVGVTDADGQPFVFEAYTPRTQLQADSTAIFGALLPLNLGALLLLVVLLVPFALSLARRVDRANAQRATILRRSLQAWHQERARVAQVLHDDVIQDLSALSYALPTVLVALPEDPRGQAARGVGRQLGEAVVASLRTLRGMLADLVPTGVDGVGLVRTLQSLAQRTRDAGLPVRLEVDEDLAPGPTVGGLVYRAVREGLLNVQHHAEAREAVVVVRRRGPYIEVLVDDDGTGPDPDGETGDDHVGLRVLGRLLEDVGGSAKLYAPPGGGARLRVIIPARLPDLDDETWD